jgi:hypothetical protein
MRILIFFFFFFFFFSVYTFMQTVGLWRFDLSDQRSLGWRMANMFSGTSPPAQRELGVAIAFDGVVDDGVGLEYSLDTNARHKRSTQM